ncbi:polysaccharide biosynthesis C-terminal domain-containing protein [Novosphingobium sp. MBES04]|uniref:polysaccharide biosynthesis C-terminal domain-containing protein n=1 Tax=Novosphingobium sp. MBES04 TaxID=1206458 RepID=UPI00069480B7|nr:polysaccharide biosynthesis C-terminal domain-containing protein [Novosphingobium sp. MBES04]GAM04448.1 hypothetical protein MBENS4_1446 [Novosphingobium sp. MBES04]
MAQPAVALALGDKWLGAIPVLQWLSLTLIPPLLTAPYSSLAMALNRPQGLLGQRAAELVFKVPLMVVGAVWYGIEGAVGARAISALTTALIVMVMTRRLIGVSVWHQLWATWRTLLASGGLVAVLYALRPRLADLAGLELALGIGLVAGLGMAVYGLILALAWHQAGRPAGIESMAHDRVLVRVLERLRGPRAEQRSA